MSAQHTPGPWFAKGRYIGTKNHMSYIGECRNAAGNWSDDEPASANARLIAAAPDLLEALKPFSDACTISNADDDSNIDDTLAACKITWADLRRARSAIAKATGAA